MSARVAGFVFRFRYLLCALIVGGFFALLPSVNLTRIDNDITMWIEEDDPIYQTYERFREEFGGQRLLLIALESDRIFTPAGLAFIRRVTADIERVDAVERVHSLATANIVRALPADPASGEDGGIEVQPLLDETGADAGAVRDRALNDPLLKGDLVSADGRVTVVVVSFDEARIDDVRGEVIDRIRQLVDPRLPDGMRAHYNGSIEISETYNRVTRDNLQNLTPPIAILTLLAIYVMFRSWRITGLLMVAVVMSVVWTLGVYVLMGFTFNVLASMLPPLVMILAIADDVHIVQHFNHELRVTGSKEHAFKSSVQHLFVPLLGASATTALGLASLATSQVASVRAFGLGAAAGVMVDFVMSLVLVPTLLMLIRPETVPAPQERYLLVPMQRVARFSMRYARQVVVGAALLLGVATAGIQWLRVDTNHINFFADGHPLHESAKVIDEQLSGIYSFNILLEGDPDSMKSTDALRRMEELRVRLEKLPFVRRVVSVADYVKRVNRELNGGDAAAAVVPASADAIAQELFLFGLSDDGRRELDRIVASDYSRAQMSVKMASMSSDVVFEQINVAEREAMDVFAGSGITPTVTGSGHIFATLDHYIVVSQLSSFGTAFLTVFAVIFIVFRSARFGVLAIIANALPVAAVLGFMGWLGISLNVATVMVASVALGIVDDDTIHFIGRFRREAASGAGTEAAIEAATMHEGRASLTTAVINSLGYGIMVFSAYKPTAWFGGLLALTMAVAFLAEVLVVPAVITLLPRIFGAPRFARVGAGTALLLALAAAPAAAQGPVDGYVSVMFDVLPDAAGADGRQTVGELRTRVFAERKADIGEHVRVNVAGYVDGLLADRGALGATGTARDATVRPSDFYVEFAASRFDLRAGMSRMVWGRLDEFQPTDVVNPIDLTRFVLEGRGEARLSVALVRGRMFLPGGSTLEAVVVPAFRASRFDQLDEPTSPFNLLRLDPAAGEGAAYTVRRDEPAFGGGSVQGGGRFTSTVRRVDWGVSAYRGFRTFPTLTVLPTFAPPPVVVESFPRFTMIGGDFETVRGPWAFRGELAVFPRDELQSTRAVRGVPGRSVEGGVGVDRRAGEFRIAANVLWSLQRVDGSTPLGQAFAGDDELERSAVSLVVAADRSFSRETRTLRVFTVYDPGEATVFSRLIAAVSIRDNVWVEGSGGIFAGSSLDTIGRLTNRDFGYVRLKVFF